MRMPVVYFPQEIKNWPVDEEYSPGKYRLSRPCGFSSLQIKTRLKILWGVFTGKLDVLNWEYPPLDNCRNEPLSYRDVTHPLFGKDISNHK